MRRACGSYSSTRSTQESKKVCVFYAFDCHTNHHINFIVQFTEKKLQREGQPTSAQLVTTRSSFSNPEFCDVVRNMVSSMTELQMRFFDSKFQVAVTCDRFREHFWTCTNFAIHTSVANIGIVPTPDQFTAHSQAMISKMITHSKVFGYGILHEMDYSSKPPQVS